MMSSLPSSRTLPLLLLALVACADGSKDSADSAVAATGVELADVEALFAGNCTTCHAEGGQNPDLLLTAGNAEAELVDVPSDQLPEMDRVEPGDPDNSYLMHKVQGSHQGVGGSGDSMPPPFGLAGGDLDLLEEWIEGL